MQMLQNRASRIGRNSSYDTPSKQFLEEPDWKTFDELIIECEIVAYKFLNGLAPQYLCDFCTRLSALSSHSLRSSETDLRLPLARTSNGQKCFFNFILWDVP